MPNNGFRLTAPFALGYLFSRFGPLFSRAPVASLYDELPEVFGAVKVHQAMNPDDLRRSVMAELSRIKHPGSGRDLVAGGPR